MLKAVIRLVLVIGGSMMFASWLWQVVPPAEPRLLKVPTVEEWSKPFGKNYTPPVNDHLPSEFYTKPFKPESLERQ